jgi:hypothetical protein
LGDDAPDFVVSNSGPPTLGVFQLAADEVDSDEDEDDDKEEAKNAKLFFE